MERVNHLAVVASAVAVFLLGWLWYTLLFHSMYMAALGLSAAPAAMPVPTLLIEIFVCCLVLAYFAAMAIAKAPNPDMQAGDGIMFGLFTGVGFFGVPYLMTILSEGRPLSLWFINAGYVTLSLIVIGAIVTGWKKRAVAA